MTRLNEDDLEFKKSPVGKNRRSAITKVDIILKTEDEGEQIGEYMYQITDNFSEALFEIDGEKVYGVLSFDPKKHRDVKGSGTVTMGHIIKNARGEGAKYIVLISTDNNREDEKKIRSFLNKFKFKGKKFVEISPRCFRYELD